MKPSITALAFSLALVLTTATQPALADTLIDNVNGMSLDRDGNPVWSPDGARLAWIRQAAAPRPRMFSPRRTADEPWSVRVADVKSGQGREIWKADSGYGSAFQGVVARSQLYWGAGDRLVFPWEKTGWRLLYSIPAAGGSPTVLTPGRFEVEYVGLSPDRARLVYNANQDDIDRRRVWSVPVDGSAPPRAITTTGIAWQLYEADIKTLDPEMTPAGFVYDLSREDFETEFGKVYAEPGYFAKFFAFLVKLVPDVGPFEQSVLKPLPASWLPAESLDAFFASATSLRDEVDQLALEEAREAE